MAMDSMLCRFKGKFNLFWEMSVQGPPSQCAVASSQLDNGRAFATPSQCTVASYPPAFVI